MQTFIVVVNYNNWKDTVVCLEDLTMKEWENFTIIIVENGSTDNSSQQIKKYLNGELDLYLEDKFPKWKKEYIIKNKNKRQIVFVESEINEGFASGNNLGIKKAFELGSDNFYVWLLNNDTVVHEEALSELKVHFAKENYGLTGSMILNFDPPHNIQAINGSFDKYTGRIKVQTEFGKKISYPIGASLFTHSKILSKVGLLDEEYFLYYEELDYAIRVQKLGYKIGIADKSIVYHKQGATTKSKRGKKKKNLKIEQYKYTGLKRLYRKNYPELQYAAYLQLFIKGIKTSLKLQFQNSKVIFKSMIS